GDDRERTERGEPVGGQVEHGARETVGAGRHHGGEDEPGVHDRGVGQETFDVALGHGHDRGDHHGENGHGPQHGFPHLDGSAEGYEEHPQEGTERGNHGAGPHEGGDGGGSTLVDVGLPAVEGYRADLEEHPDGDHADPHEQERLGLPTLEDVRATGGHGLTDRTEVHRARVAVDHGDP